MKQHQLVYPIPILTRPLPAAIRVDGFLAPEHCRELMALAERKGLEPITKSRHGQETFSAAGCWIQPEDDELVFRLFAEKAVEINQEYWRLSLAGIYTGMSVLRYRAGDWIRPHIDVDYRLADATKLSCVVQLAAKDAFRGGVLTVAETEAYGLDVGDGCSFPPTWCTRCPPSRAASASCWPPGSRARTSPELWTTRQTHAGQGP